MNGNGGLRCPVCQVRFRGAWECSRCGADLTALMLLAAHAYNLRQAAQQSLSSGDSHTALASVQAAQGLHSTAEGNLLQLVCAAAADALGGRGQGSGSKQRHPRANGLSTYVGPDGEQGPRNSFDNSQSSSC